MIILVKDKDEKSGNDLSAAATPDKDSTNGDNENDNSEDGEGGDWKPKSLAESLPAHQFLHIPPHRLEFLLLMSLWKKSVKISTFFKNLVLFVALSMMIS